MGGGISEDLAALARLHGVWTEFNDQAGKTHRAGSDELVAVLRALGVPIEGPGDAAGAIRSRRAEVARRMLEPVAVAWRGGSGAVTLRLPKGLRSGAIRVETADESGEKTARDVKPADLERAPEASSEAEGIDGYRLPLEGAREAGYRRLRVEAGGESAESMIIDAPVLGYQGRVAGRTWGLFCPLYALKGRSSWGAGDLSDLEALVDWTAGLGGGVVATLPMLAGRFDDPEAVSPYSPVTRLFWNEFYLDPRRLPEARDSEAARALLDSPEFAREVEALRATPLIDYPRQARLKRRIIRLLADAALASGRPPGLAAFLKEHPEAEAYARFRAATDRGGSPGDFRPSRPEDASAERYHLYAQWRLDEALAQLGAGASAKGVDWCVDYTVGVGAGSFDVHHWPGLFAAGASTGCPPDEVFTRAQNWCLPPLHPDRHRESHYAYGIAALRSHLRHAGALRIDHVMGLHRLYWIPEGADKGAYVTYPAEEMHAILAVESHRQRAWIVGEDLGTIPPEVPRSMERHGLLGLYILQHELFRAGPNAPPAAIPRAVVASVNTHDLHPFAAFWEGRDVADRAEAGVLDAPSAEAELADRPDLRRNLLALLREHGFLGDDDSPARVVRAVGEFLAASEARAVVLNLEDFWLEAAPQNLPGTGAEKPNWRRKLARDFDDFSKDPGILDALRRIDALRRTPETGSGA